MTAVYNVYGDGTALNNIDIIYFIHIYHKIQEYSFSIIIIILPALNKIG